MINLGEGWITEGLRIYHRCDPGHRVDLLEGRSHCDCGVIVPRRVRHFAGWLVNGENDIAVAAFLDQFDLIDPDDHNHPGLQP